MGHSTGHTHPHENYLNFLYALANKSPFPPFLENLTNYGSSKFTHIFPFIDAGKFLSSAHLTTYKNYIYS